MEDLLNEAESGMPVVPGSLIDSEVFKRVSLPNTSKKFMPTKGIPLSYSELSILKYWIEQGADSTAIFDQNTMNNELVDLLLRDYRLDVSPKPYYEKVSVEPLSEEVLNKLRDNGFHVQHLGEENNLIDVRFMGGSIDDQTIQMLLEAKRHITFLKLSNCNLKNEHLSIIAELPHLTTLDIHSNTLNDMEIEKLTALNHLEVLNIYDNQMTEEGIKHLMKLPALKRLYIWQNSVSPEYLKEFENGSVRIISGIEEI